MMKVCGQLHSSAILIPQKESPVPSEQEAAWASGLVWSGHLGVDRCRASAWELNCNASAYNIRVVHTAVYINIGNTIILA
jgi:hypothetical protein